jgi:small subunit ribosomal protein S12
MPGEFAGRKLHKTRKKFRWKKVTYVSKKAKLWKQRPFAGAPQVRGLVISKRTVERRKPSSGLAKAVRVQLIKNNVQVTAFVPGYNAINHINEHDEVLIEGIGGAQGGAKGDTPGLKFQVIGVNGVALSQILTGKKQKPAR